MAPADRDPPAAGLGQVPAWLAGGRAAVHTPAGVLMLAAVHEAAAHLQRHASPAVRALGAGFEAWLADGGDLEHCLGLRPRRGRGHEKLPRLARKQARDDAIRLLARPLEGDRAQQARSLADLLRSQGHPAVRVIRAHGAGTPTSERQLLRILRED